MMAADQPRRLSPPDARLRASGALLLGGFFLLAGIAKLVSIGSFQGVVGLIVVHAFGDSGLPLPILAGVLTVGVIAAEVGTGLSLVIFSRTPRWPATAAGSMLIIFSIVLVYIATMDEPPACGCLGAWELVRDSAHMSAYAGLVRNIGLIVFAAWLCGRGSPASSRYSIRRQAGWRGGFTLIEILVVIIVSAVLIAMLLPALKGAKAHAREVETLSALRQCNASVAMYAELERGYFPYLATPGEPGRGGMTGYIWTGTPPSYFKGQSSLWPTALRKHGIDLSGIKELTAYDGPARIHGWLWMTHAAHARPEYWTGELPPDTDRYFGGVRLDEALFPASKGLLLDVDPVIPPYSVRPALWNVGFVDGSAAMKSTYHPDADVEGLGRPFGAVSWRVLTTEDGIRGLDY